VGETTPVCARCTTLNYRLADSMEIIGKWIINEGADNKGDTLGIGGEGIDNLVGCTPWVRHDSWRTDK
jgi:hypothetical protein